MNMNMNNCKHWTDSCIYNSTFQWLKPILLKLCKVVNLSPSSWRRVERWEDVVSVYIEIF